MDSLNIHFDHQLPWNSSDSLPQMILKNTQDGKSYSAKPLIAAVNAPAPYYSGGKNPDWGGTGQYAQYTFEGLPDGNYQIDAAILNSQYSQIEKAGSFVIPWQFVDSSYYGNHTIAYAGAGSSQNMLMLLYNGGNQWKSN